MTLGDLLIIAGLVTMGFGGGIIYKNASEEAMIVPTTKHDGTSEFDKVHGNPPWMAETMIIHKDLGNYWLVVEETETKTCHLMYRRAAASGGTGKWGYISDTVIPGKNCAR